LSLKRKNITVFEHQVIKLGQSYNGVVFNSKMLEALEKHYGEKGVRYFYLVHNGIAFNEHVGILQVGDITIEVLPKADNDYSQQTSYHEKKYWREMLIDMLRAVGTFNIHTHTNSMLNLKPNSILDLYIELFITEVKSLLHAGLVKKYRKTEGNTTSLKGNILFAKHIQQNYIRKERFYTKYTTYDTNHLLHCILYKTILLLKQINTNTGLNSHISKLAVCFPEMPNINATEETFENIAYNRKTEPYRKAIEIAYLLLLRYHPDLTGGNNHVLALMFDMNSLWEQFIYTTLKKYGGKDFSVSAKRTKTFWKSDDYRKSSFMSPDIIINENKPSCAILDTKWKNILKSNPSSQDLRQMYVYLEYYGAKKVALIYPGKISNNSRGFFMPSASYDKKDKECSVIFFEAPKESKRMINIWQKQIKEYICKWLQSDN